MKRSTIGLIVALSIFSALGTAAAQPPGKPFRVGFLCPYGTKADGFTPFLQGLRDLGYAEGQNLAVKFKGCALGEEYLHHLAVELVRSGVEVIVASGTTGVQAAKNATTTIPIVFLGVDDPVALGLVASLARPSGNLTGLSSMSPELNGKRLELLKEMVPHASRVALLVTPAIAIVAPAMLREAEVAARSLGIQLQLVEVQTPNYSYALPGASRYPDSMLAEFERAFSTMARAHADVLIVLPDPMFYDYRWWIASRAAKFHLPAMYWDQDYVDHGGLIAYGPSLADQHRRAATYVHKILKGAKPADLPVEQPMKFELAINLQTAQALGLTIPPHILALADKVIR